MFWENDSNQKCETKKAIEKLIFNFDNTDDNKNTCYAGHNCELYN